ncbi:DUF899 domain-containing protein [Ferrovibrio sp.]|uniref:DUF899 domain-containing protein n=1 Tax=Ferrovibrio sp. TaxID=1917215 RepID=UPI0025C28532|nr:DUF899 domain-containing protein [Ferrovibrio sp.]MBX3455058.1 DUF899 domain-containing protein [Ferrovibrio sp.]
MKQMPAMANPAMPEIVSRDEWRAARLDLLKREKEITRARDALNAQRRRLPMVRVDKDYVFEGPEGRFSLIDLFAGRRQLIVYHFMFDADGPPPGKSGAPWEEGCPGCSHIADNLPHLSHLHARDTTLVMISLAPLVKIAPFKARMGWTMPWYSSHGSDFNMDFDATVDPARPDAEWNFRPVADLLAEQRIPGEKGELPGISVFLRDGDAVYHTYSAYSRALDGLLNTHNLLDLTPYGRQEPWEDSPPGWPKGEQWWLRHHDRYDDKPQSMSCCAD